MFDMSPFKLFRKIGAIADDVPEIADEMRDALRESLGTLEDGVATAQRALLIVSAIAVAAFVVGTIALAKADHAAG